jgi:hypothetical protein
VSLVQANAPDRILEAVAAAPEPVRGELLRIAKRVMGSGRRD